jgi:2,3-diaminopropionate biosynthesis protein SbnA
MIYNSIVETIGNTPVVPVHSFPISSEHQLFLKLEYFNPTSSIKDRAAAYIIQNAERANLLTANTTIIESTSGNFGKSLAMIGASRGYRIVVVVDPKISKATLSFFKALGAEIEMVAEPDETGSFQSARLKRVQELRELIPDSFWSDQYSNPNNPQVHADITAYEILADFGQLDILVASVSTGGHLSGLAKTLKQNLPDLRVVAVDAVGSSIFGHHYKPYLMNGIGLSWQPANLYTQYIDYVQIVSDVNAFSTARLLAKHEGILIGGSGGAVLFASISVLQREKHPRRILGIVPDTGLNYLEQFYDDAWLDYHKLSLIASRFELVRAASQAASEITTYEKQ